MLELFQYTRFVAGLNDIKSNCQDIFFIFILTSLYNWKSEMLYVAETSFLPLFQVTK